MTEHQKQTTLEVERDGEEWILISRNWLGQGWQILRVVNKTKAVKIAKFLTRELQWKLKT